MSSNIGAGPPPAPAPGPSGPKPSNAPQTSSTATATTTKKKKTVTKASGAAGTQAKPKKPASSGAAPRRRKATTPKPTSASQTQHILNEARSAQADLALQKAQQASKRTDPLWYQMEDVLPSIPEFKNDGAAFQALPERMETIVERALSYAGLSRADVTPQAMACLLEHARTYSIDLLVDAQDYALSANRMEVTRQDLQLAIDMNPDANATSSSSHVPKLNLMAQQINRVPLPPIPPQCYNGILLPPKQHQLTARTFDILCASSVSKRMSKTMPVLRKTVTMQQEPQAYGATKGPQIPIVLKTAMTNTTASGEALTTTAAPVVGGESSSNEQEQQQQPAPMDVDVSDPLRPISSSNNLLADPSD
ncbi:hypothetical protein MPSEU_000682500 [Mayamaea pseudoterrestris]|nr:hypothetical protein MPSEU_000682500 [Mayamaea pseudoterrestris]